MKAMNLEPGDFVKFELTDDKTAESEWMWLRLGCRDVVLATSTWWSYPVGSGLIL